MIRQETPGDHGAVAELLRLAFGGDEVPRLVEALRAGDGFVPELALVAEDDGRVAGHGLITMIDIEEAPGRRRPLACLSPLAVHPAARGRGHARRLVERGLEIARRRGEPLVVLEGAPALYSRFGFVPAAAHGLRRPSERIPRDAFQVCLLGGPHPTGRVLYPNAFWDTGSVGLPMAGVAWLDTFERLARLVEDAAPAGEAAPVPACPGWTVRDVVAHLGVVHRVVRAWIEDGRRPRGVPAAPDDVLGWYAEGWRALHDGMDARPADEPAATWSPWETTMAFWRRRQAHELAIHALDVCEALGQPWSVPDDVALDGVDEALRLWLGTRLGQRIGGDGSIVRVSAGPDQWTVGLHPEIAEIHRLPTPADASVSGAPVEVYRWLWGRDGDVSLDGDAAALLRGVLARAMQ